MHKYLAIACLAVTAAVAGCATDPNYANRNAKSTQEGEIYTGSRIPKKAPEAGSKTMTGEAWRRENTQAIGNAPRGN